MWMCIISFLVSVNKLYTLLLSSLLTYSSTLNEWNGSPNTPHKSYYRNQNLNLNERSRTPRLQVSLDLVEKGICPKIRTSYFYIKLS